MVVIIKAGGAAHLRTLVMRERGIAMALVMEVVMMAILVVKKNLCVGATIANSLVLSTTKRMIVVRNHPSLLLCQILYQVLALPWLSHLQGRGAVVVTTKAGGAVHLRTLVMRERGIVMGLAMEVVMMDILDVKEN